MSKICIISEVFERNTECGDIGLVFLSLAEFFIERNFDVTFLFCTSEKDDLSQCELAKYCEKSKELKFDILFYQDHVFTPLTPEKKSYAIYQKIKNLPYNQIHFYDYGGLGFSTFSAKKQGTFFQNSQLVLHLMRPHSWLRENEKIIFYNKEQMKKIFMEQESIAKADLLISPSKEMSNYLKAVYPTVLKKNPINVLCPSEKKTVGKEIGSHMKQIVFVSLDLNNENLRLFANAIKKLASTIFEKNIGVWFYGDLGYVNGFEAEKYLNRVCADCLFDIFFIQGASREQFINFASDFDSSLFIVPAAEAFYFYKTDILASGNKAIIGYHSDQFIDDSTSPSKYFFDESSLINRINDFLSDDLIIHEQDLFQTYDYLIQEISKFNPTDVKSISEGLVTIGITHFERPSKLVDAIKSVLLQDYKNIEIIILDDGSIDPMARNILLKLQPVFERNSILYIEQDNKYLGSARNNIIQNANGEYIIFLDDDDIAKSNLVSMLFYAAKYSNATAVNCLNIFMDEQERYLALSDFDHFHRKVSYVPLGGPLSLASYDNCLGSATTLFNVSDLKEIGGYTELENVGFEDYELFINLIHSGKKIEIVPEVLYLYEIRGGGMCQSTFIQRNYKRISDAFGSLVNDRLAHQIIDYSVGIYAQNLHAGEIQYSQNHEDISSHFLSLPNMKILDSPPNSVPLAPSKNKASKKEVEISSRENSIFKIIFDKHIPEIKIHLMLGQKHSAYCIFSKVIFIVLDYYKLDMSAFLFLDVHSSRDHLISLFDAKNLFEELDTIFGNIFHIYIELLVEFEHPFLEDNFFSFTPEKFHPILHKLKE